MIQSIKANCYMIARKLAIASAILMASAAIAAYAWETPIEFQIRKRQEQIELDMERKAREMERKQQELERKQEELEDRLRRQQQREGWFGR